MRENAEFIGRHSSEEDKSSARKALSQWSSESFGPVEGEGQKTPGELKIIETVRQILGDELRSLGIKDYNSVPTPKIHILTDEIFSKRFPDVQNHAFYMATDADIFINRGRADTPARMLSTIPHESIHAASTQKFFSNTEEGSLSDARVGYRVRSEWKEPSRVHRLEGFNEAMNDYTMYKILLRNQKVIGEEIDVNGPIYTYLGQYQPLIDRIVEKIAKDRNISQIEAFNKLERGQFENSILSLKEIGYSFGEGSIEALAFLGYLRGEKGEDLDRMIMDFFKESNAPRRAELLHSIKTLASERDT